MPLEMQPVENIVAWLAFRAEPYPTLYLNPERIRLRFRGMIGSVLEFVRRAETSSKASAGFQAVVVSAGIEGVGVDAAEVRYDMADPQAQALVLRACLQGLAVLDDDPRAATVADFAVARGPGGIIPGFEVDQLDSRGWADSDVSLEVRTEIVQAREEQVRWATASEPAPSYWVCYIHTPRGLVISLLSERSIIGTEVRQYSHAPMSYCVFGHKVQNFESWTLMAPLHVWGEPEGSPRWG